MKRILIVPALILLASLILPQSAHAGPRSHEGGHMPLDWSRLNLPYLNPDAIPELAQARGEETTGSAALQVTSR